MLNRLEKKTPNQVDILVGQRIRIRRIWMEMAQQALGEAIGVTFQQVQKYEKGRNRIGAGRLQLIADTLGVPVSYFFGDAPKDGSASDESSGSGKNGVKSEVVEFLEFAATPHGLSLAFHPLSLRCHSMPRSASRSST
ncbi:helix-turn-helix domain-containing protein [Rhizobium tibeticum]|uniref:helix-turn-helix domain-containing protein n=1 Tax=Rhizobium tibeticum TaxID=501024 RepID=UPI001FCCF02B|nr:helix-turn-helix transcriptional regulator [Rhizobium tibeticum]